MRRPRVVPPTGPANRTYGPGKVPPAAGIFAIFLVFFAVSTSSAAAAAGETAHITDITADDVTGLPQLPEAPSEPAVTGTRNMPGSPSNESHDVPPVASDPAAQKTGDPRIEAQTHDLAKQLRCPVCQGLSIEDSPTELSQEMKDVIREQLRSGKSPDEVKAYFVGRYGEWILLEPPAKGFNLTVYWLPWLALGLGLAFVLFQIRRWTRPSAQSDGPSSPLREDEAEDADEVVETY